MSRQQELARKLASYKGHLDGRIGPVERSVCNQLITAKYKHADPLPTGDLVKAVYLSPYGRKSRWMDKDAPPPKLAHHLWGKACRSPLGQRQGLAAIR